MIVAGPQALRPRSAAKRATCGLASEHPDHRTYSRSSWRTLGGHSVDSLTDLNRPVDELTKRVTIHIVETLDI